MNILILGCVSSYAVERFLKASNNLGVRALFVFATGHRVDADGLDSENILQVPSLDPTHIEALEHAIADWGHPIDAVLPGGELVVPTVSVLAKRLGCRHAGPDMELFRDKLKMRQAVQAANLPQPKVLAVCRSKHDIPDIPIPYPVIVKPRDCAASFHVRKCDNEEELRAAIQAIADHKQSSATGVRFRGEALVETIASGAEYSVEGAVQDGELKFIHSHCKVLSSLPYFDEIGHVTLPASAPEAPILADTLRKLVKALGLVTGIVHAEFRLEADTAQLIEIAARIGGDMISDLTELSTGISLEETMIQILLLNAKPLSLQSNINRIAGVGFLFSDNVDIPADIKVVKRGRSQAYAPAINASEYHVTRRCGYFIFYSKSHKTAIDHIRILAQ